jgi:ribosomal protein L16 Arg81 hydroxylase/predicted enzyme related to lactoylglutathione lyase
VTITIIADGPAREGAGPVETLVHPLTCETFLSEHWQRRPVHLTGWPERFAGLFDRAALHRALERQHELDLSVRVSGDREGDDGGASAHLLVDATETESYLRAGTSLCVDPVDRADPAVASLAKSLQVGLGHVGAVSVKCYLSTSGYGFNTHFDAQVVTTVQIEGTKRWRVSRKPGVRFPRDNAFVDSTGRVRYIGRTPGSLRQWERVEVDLDDFEEVVLLPGDVLCLPAGTWHNAKAPGGSSMALNFSFAPVDLPGLLASVVRTELMDSEAWRRGVQATHLVGQALAERAYELSALLQQLARDPDLLAARVAELVEAEPAGSTPVRPAAASHAAAAAASATWAGRRVQCVLGVSDVERATEWYRRVLGSTVVSTIPEFGWVELSTNVGGLTLGLTEMPTNVSNRGAVLDFEVDDLNRIRAVLEANGVAVRGPVAEIAGVARIVSAHDLDGNQLMFFEPHDQGAADG